MIERGKRLYLCKPSGKLLTQLNGVQTESVSCSEHLKDYWTLDFTVERTITLDDGTQVLSNGYDALGAYMELYLEDVGYFQMQEPAVQNDGKKETKTVKAYDISKEFENKSLTGFLINKGTTDSMEYLAPDNVDDLGFAKKYVIFCRSNQPELSLMHLVLEKMPGWSIGHVSPLFMDNEAKRMSVEGDNTNIYAFLTSTVAPKMDCIFRFDIRNKTLNVYDKEEIGEDTTVFIGFRNLAKSVDISCDEDSISTQLTVTGDSDLDIRPVNFNERWIRDFSFFMNDRYMSTEMMDKLKSWIAYRESRRPAFIQLSRQVVDLESKIQEITYRAPNDGCDWSQWDNMTEELLKKNQNYYNVLLTSLQISVDPDYEGEAKDYLPWKKPDGSIDHERYLKLLYERANGYGGYYTYLQVKDYILPNIQIAIDNLGIPEDDKKKPIKEFETNWDLYGIELLKAKKKSYEENFKTLKGYEKSWSELSPEEKASHTGGESDYNIKHKQYKEMQDELGSEDKEGTLLYKLKQLTGEVTTLTDQQDSYTKEKIDMIADVSMENKERWDFSQGEIILYNKLIHDQTYTNSNILSTSVQSTLDTLKVQETLYQDGVDKLSELSQPQYSFTTELDNLLALEEFKCWQGDFLLGNFVRLGIRDDYAVKLRLIGRTWNPCETMPTLTVEFSNMITSRSGRNDFTQILQNENERGSTGGGVALGTGNSKDDKEYLTTLLQNLVSSGLFHSSVTDITGNSLKVSYAEIEKQVSNYIRAATIDVGKITGDEASFDKLFSEYIDADYIAARVIIGDSAEFQKLTADVATIHKIIAGNIIGEEGLFINLTSSNVHISDAVIKDLIAAKISVADLQAHQATAEIITLVSSHTGQTSIAFAEGTQQFYDNEGHVRVQIGQDSQSNFNFIVRGADGKTALFDENGITTQGISDGLIKDSMLGTNEISKDKLNFPIVKTDENGKVSITEILDGKGGLFGTSYTEFQNTITSTTSALDKKIDENLSYRLELSSSKGNIFTNGQIDTYLTITLYRGNNDATSEYPDCHFKWTRQSSDSDLDEYWNSQHLAGTKALHITREDIYKKAQFCCSFVLDDKVVAATTSKGGFKHGY